MYKIDNAKIAQHGLKNPDGLISIIRFTLLSIQQPLSSCDSMISDVESVGLGSRFLNAGNHVTKRDGLTYAIAHKKQLFRDLKAYAQNGLDDVENISNALYCVYQIPHIGMVKAGFILQMLGFDVACIDSHNLERLGWKQSQVSLAKGLKYETKIKKIRAYISMTQEKGTAYWWNSWCHYVAGNIGNRKLTTGQQVSQFHVRCVIR
jgi:hypothetical protein